jgi:hypothetical protein
MKAEEFAYHLACWMSPGVLARAAGDWSDVPAGHEPIRLRCESPLLVRSTDAHFDWFVRTFLENVIIPEELIRFVQGVYSSHVTCQAADWLRHFKFTGELAFDPDDQPMPSGRIPLICVTAPRCEIRVIWPVIEMLNDLLSGKANYWRQVASIRRPQEIHIEGYGEWEFEAWVDLQVARACGFPSIGKAGKCSPVGLITNVRGRASICGPLPTDELHTSMFAMAIQSHPAARTNEFMLHKELEIR